MHDPAAAVGAVYGDRRALDALLPGIGWRDLASIDLVVEIVARPEQAGIHIAQCMADLFVGRDLLPDRSEEHTSELQSLMRISYAVFCLKKKTTHLNHSQ